MVSANIAICTPAEPITAGPSVLKKPRIGRSKRGRAKPGASPARLASAHTSRNSRTPAMATPSAAAWPAVGKTKASASAAIMEALRRTGAAAAAAKRSCAFSSPESSVTRVMKSRYGKVMRVSVTASANLLGSSENPGASRRTIHGMPTNAATSSATCAISIRVKTRSAKSLAFAASSSRVRA